MTYHVTKHIRDKKTDKVDVLEMDKPKKVIDDLIECANKHLYEVTQTFKKGILTCAMVNYDNDVKDVKYFIRLNEE